MITFTLPHSVNPLARSNQKLVYRLLFQTSAKALHALALNPKWLGGRIGMVGALGFLHPGAKARFTALQQNLEDTVLDPRDCSAPDDGTTSKAYGDTQHTPDHPGVCPHCGGALRYVGNIARRRPGMLPLVSQRGPPTRKEEESS